MLSRLLPYIFVLTLFSSFRGTECGNLLYYKGTLGNSQKIQMNFELLENNNLKGSYIIEKTGDIYVLNGNMNSSTQIITLEVFNHYNEKVATIEAHYIVNSQQEMQDIAGVWMAYEDELILPLKLVKLAEYIA